MPTIQRTRISPLTGKITYQTDAAGTLAPGNTGPASNPISFTVRTASGGTQVYDPNSTSQIGNAIVLTLRNLVAGSNIVISESNGLITIAGTGAAGPAGPTGPAGESVIGATGPTGPARTAVRAEIQWTSGAIVEDDTTYFIFDPPYDGTVNSLTYYCETGSYTVTVQINGVDVTGLSAITVDNSTTATASASDANTFSAGQPISAVVSDASGNPTDTVLSLNVSWS